MKIRNGFVSNSSSSSFLVGFKDIPATEQEMVKMLFGSNNTLRYYENLYPADEIAAIVLRDLLFGSPLSEEEIKEELNSGYLGRGYGSDDWRYHRADAVEDKFHKQFPGKDVRDDPEWSKKWREALNEDWKEQDRLREEGADRFWQEHKQQFEGTQIYKFHYSDNESPMEAAMEHGGIFNALPCVRVSHH